MLQSNIPLVGKQRLTHPWQWVDWLYLQTGKGKLFGKGWGDPELTNLVVDKSRGYENPSPIDPAFKLNTHSPAPGIKRYDYQFLSPVSQLPEEVKTARGCLILPDTFDSIYDAPVCLSMPGSGEEGYDRRIKALAIPLASQGIATLVFGKTRFYGSRRRQGQHKHHIQTVSDFMLMFYSAVQECKALVDHWQANGPKASGFDRV